MIRGFATPKEKIISNILIEATPIVISIVEEGIVQENILD